MSDKIINTFQQRRELQTRIALLEDTQTEGEMLKIVRAIAHDFPTELIGKALLKALNTSNSQLRGGLAHLATMLPPEDVITVLREAVADRNNAIHTRLNSVTILERFLGEEVSPALLGDLENTDEIAFQSLCEAVEEGRRERHIFLEYVVQMREEDVEVAFIVMDQLRRLPSGDQLDLLRLMAQDDREPVAVAALNRLEQISPDDAGERLAQIIYSLQFTLPPELARRAERAARKLRFNGHGYKVPKPDGWRALISPAEASGNQTIWFFKSSDSDNTSSESGNKDSQSSDVRESPFISIVVNRATGILQTYGSDHMPLEDLPGSHRHGELLTVALDGGDTIVFLEAPFEYGRWLIYTSLRSHWSEEAWYPLFGEYSLYSDMLWHFAAPEIPESLAEFFAPSQAAEAKGDVGKGDVALNVSGKPANSVSNLEDLERLDQMAADLLSHPAMGSWVLHSYLFWNAIRAGFPHEDAESAEQLTHGVLKEVVQWPERDVFVNGIINGLQCQAAWLTLAGMEKAASQAHQLATSFSAGTLEQNPFLYRYICQAIEAKT